MKIYALLWHKPSQRLPNRTRSSSRRNGFGQVAGAEIRPQPIELRGPQRPGQQRHAHAQGLIVGRGGHGQPRQHQGQAGKVAQQQRVPPAAQRHQQPHIEAEYRSAQHQQQAVARHLGVARGNGQRRQQRGYDEQTPQGD